MVGEGQTVLVVGPVTVGMLDPSAVGSERLDVTPVPGGHETRMLRLQLLDQTVKVGGWEGGGVGPELANETNHLVLPVGDRGPQLGMLQEEPQEVRATLGRSQQGEQLGLGFVPGRHVPLRIEEVGRVRGQAIDQATVAGVEVGRHVGQGQMDTGQVVEVVAFGLAETEGVGQGPQDLGRHAPGPSLLDPGQPGHTDAGQDGHLLASQPGRPPGGRHGQTGNGRTQALPATPQEVAQLLAFHHLGGYRSASPR